MAKTSASIIRQRKERVAAILPILKKTYPNAKCSLDHQSPFELLVATILSAQCTDARVNKVTPALFAKYKTAQDFADAPPGELEKDIQSTGFFNSKARNLRAMAAALVQHHDGKVPQTMEDLTKLAGIGRKTANVVLGNAFNRNVGVVVDTHVGRLSQRLGLTKQTSPEKIELDLMEIIPPEDWTLWAHLMIYHGRAICLARQPKCSECAILKYCATGKKIVASA